MRNELINVTEARLTLGKQKGLYTGTAYNSLLSIAPDGFGKLEFPDGSYLEGRFKNGVFVNGTAVTADNTTYKGDFDNYTWLGGTINYSNGDYIEGKVDPKTKTLTMTSFRLSQRDSEGSKMVDEAINVISYNETKLPNIEPFTSKQSIATQKMGSTGIIKGKFETIFIEGNQSNFGVTKPTFNCVDTEAKIEVFVCKNKNDIKLAKNKVSNTQVGFGKLTGKYNSITQKITGTYTFKNGKISKTLVGEFLYARHPHNSVVSEDFEKYFTDFGKYDDGTPKVGPDMLGYKIILQQGDVSIKDENGIFKGTKHQKESDNSTITTFYTNAVLEDNTKNIVLSGKFNDNLKFLQGTVEIHNQGNIDNLNGSYSILNEETGLGNFKGKTIYTSKEYQSGNFKITLVANTSPCGMLKSIECPMTFVSGEFLKLFSNNRQFKGQTIDLLQKDTTQDYNKNNLNDKACYFGVFSQEANGQTILKYDGLFDKSFVLLEGFIHQFGQETSPIQEIAGKRTSLAEDEFGFVGTVKYKNGDQYEGDFKRDYTFLRGKVDEILPNGSRFIASTLNNINYNGELKRKGDYWQKGEFTRLEEKEYLFNRGKSCTYFDRDDKAKCYSNYDEDGFEQYDNKKYICVIKTNENRDVVDIFATDSVSEAMVEYDIKLNGEQSLKNHYTQEQVNKLIDQKVQEALSKNRQEIAQKYGIRLDEQTSQIDITNNNSQIQQEKQ